jgi:hypothetical protein
VHRDVPVCWGPRGGRLGHHLQQRPVALITCGAHRFAP